jgi:hypothetical protein
MTRSFPFLALFLLLAGPVFAQTNVTGDWDVTIESPQGANTVKVSFKQDGEKVSGVFKSPMGELPFDGGSMTGSDLKFGFTLPVQGMQLDITMAGKVEGSSITGKAKFGDFGEGDWTAKRSEGTTTASTTTSTTTTSTTTTTTTTSSTLSTGSGASGKWDVTLKTPGGDFPASATLTDEAGKLSGTFASQMGEAPVTGSVEGKAVKMTMVAQTPQGEMTVVMTGDLDGDAIVNGKADVSGMGQMEWTAKRVKP